MKGAKAAPNPQLDLQVRRRFLARPSYAPRSWMAAVPGVHPSIVDGLSYRQHCLHAGQRTWTLMIYLNRSEDGGATRFKAIDKIIQPETGKLLAWNNLDAHGRPNPATLHQGMKVRRGVKYVITKWYRERR